MLERSIIHYCKYSQKRLDHAKQSAKDVFKTTSKRAIRKTVEATGDLIGNRIDNRIAKVWKKSETVANENAKKIHKERYLQKKDKKLLMI